MNLGLFSLSGKVALVTGGNGGLGRGIALGLQAAGARVAVTGRRPEKNEAVARELGGPHSIFVLDVRDEAAVEYTVAQVVERFGRLDILVNNAGNFRGGPALDMPKEAWEGVIGTHLTGSFLCSKHAARAMVARGEGGKIINVASIYSLFGAPDFVNYASAKAGLLGLTRSLAIELAPHRIQVNAMLPGWFETRMTHAMPADLVENIRRNTPAARWGKPEDLAGTAVFLASRASDFVTGASILVDGGYAVSDRFNSP